MNEIPVEIRRQLLANQIGQYKNSIYISEIAYKVNKKLGSMDKCGELQKELERLNKEMDMWQAELDALAPDKIAPVK